MASEKLADLDAVEAELTDLDEDSALVLIDSEMIDLVELEEESAFLLLDPCWEDQFDDFEDEELEPWPLPDCQEEESDDDEWVPLAYDPQFSWYKKE